MDATLVDSQASTAPQTPEFKSRPGALAWAFRKSRDRWKAKCKKLKADIKRHTNRVADVTKSREHWRTQAEAAREQLRVREAEVAALRQQIAEIDAKKKSVPAACP
jgi:septal ring factor EnvC (AmiA/AmiB activator)